MRVPGLPTFSALMLSAILATWLVVAGPPNIKEWQTFLAACVALIGGTLAYRGAMAKVSLDRELAAQQSGREKLALFLRLEWSLRIFCAEVDRAVGWLTPPVFPISESRHVDLRDVTVKPPPEIDHAWAALHLFSPDAVIALAQIKSNIRTLDAAAAAWVPNHSWTYNWIGKPQEVAAAEHVLKELSAECKKLIDAIVIEVDNIRSLGAVK